MQYFMYILQCHVLFDTWNFHILWKTVYSHKILNIRQALEGLLFLYNTSAAI